MASTYLNGNLKDMPSEFIIYALVDPLTLYIRYVGQSSRGMLRPAEHCKERASRRRGHLGSWIRKLNKLGLVPKIEVLAEYSSKQELNLAEIEAIEFFRQLSKALGCPKLTNAARGGVGWSPDFKFKDKEDIDRIIYKHTILFKTCADIAKEEGTTGNCISKTLKRHGVPILINTKLFKDKDGIDRIIYKHTILFKTCKDIAKEEGVSAPCITYTLRENGIVPFKNNFLFKKFKTPESQLRIKNKYLLEGKSTELIGDEEGVSAACISYNLKKMGVDIRPNLGSTRDAESRNKMRLSQLTLGSEIYSRMVTMHIDEHVSIQKIANFFKVSRTCVMNAIRRAGKSITSSRKKKTALSL